MTSSNSDAALHSSALLNLTAIVVVVWYGVIWALSIIGCTTGRKHFRLRPRSPLSSALASSVPGVSILRPLRGLDTNLFENLESTFKQEYPNFEILLSVADADDQALGIVHSLLEKYPHVDAKVVIGEEIVGVNPKVNNLIRSYKQARYDILWVLDSNIMAAPGTLARSVDTLINSMPKNQRRIGLVHHVPYAFVSERSLGSSMEEAFLNTNHAKMYLAINRVAVESCVVGKSCMYRRSDIECLTGTLKPAGIMHPDNAISTAAAPMEERPKGLAAFGKFLAEDNMIAAALWHELGLRHALGCDVAQNTVGNMSILSYVERRVRWIRVRKHMVLSATLAEPFTECVVLSVIAAWATHRLWGTPLWVMLLLHYPAWIALDLDINESLAGYYLPVERRRNFLLAWIMRELLALPIWVIGMLGREVKWRGRCYRVLANGETTRALPGRSRWSLLSRRKENLYDRVASDPEVESSWEMDPFLRSS